MFSSEDLESVPTQSPFFRALQADRYERQQQDKDDEQFNHSVSPPAAARSMPSIISSDV